MDITTVTAIIKMIETRIEGLNLKIKTASDFDSFLKHTAQVEILTSLSNHLDCFLDQQLDAYEVESQLPEC